MLNAVDRKTIRSPITNKNINNEQVAKRACTATVRSSQRRKVKYFIITAIISFFLGIVFLHLGSWFHSRALFAVFWGLSFVVALALGAIATAILFRSGTFKARFFSSGAFIILSVLVLIGGRAFLIEFLPYVYTPPAVKPNNIAIYKECAQFVKNHDEYKNLRLQIGLLFDGRKRIEAQDEAIEINDLCHRLYEVGCTKLQRDNDMVLFYRMMNVPLPGFSPGFPSILPVGPGVLYSLTGQNPNEIDSQVLNANKPFIKIAGNWYMSRNLMLGGPRSDIHASIPKSLIDHSLKTTGLSFNDM